MKKGIFFLFCLGIAVTNLNISFSYAADGDHQNEATDPLSRMKSWEHHVKLKNESIFRHLAWRAVGPTFTGGRIETIACPPGNTFTIYVGAGAGNIWKTLNNGTTWEPIFENESTFAIGSIAIAQTNPDIVWVGTGELLMARSSYAGMGVFKTTDAGKTWQNMGLCDTHHIGKVLIDPQDANIVYVAAIGHNYTYNQQRGLFKTTDGGKTWQKILYISEKVAVIDVVMDLSDNNTLYAAAWERDRKAWNNIASGPGSGIYKTTDAGKTWNKLTDGLPDGPHIGRSGIAIAPSNPNVVYVLLENQTPLPESDKSIGGEIYRSDDKGTTWRKANEKRLETAIDYGFCIVRVSPDNKNEIYILGTKLLHSTDSGATCEFVGETIVHLLAHDIKCMHLDKHAMWIDPANPDRLLLGTDGGLYCSYDRGKTWLHINNIPISEFYAVAVDMKTPYNIYGGTQDNAALYGTSDHNVGDWLTEYGMEDHWKNVYLDQWGGGDSFFTYADPTQHHTIYFEQQFGDLQRKDMLTGSNDRIRPRAGQDQPRLRCNWMTPFVLSHYNSYVVYYGANKLFKSSDRGQTWTCISPDLTTGPPPQKQGNVPYGTITMISQSPVKPGLFYVGTDDGLVHVTHDEGENWTKINTSLPDKWVSRIEASQHESATVYVSLTGYRDDDFEKYLYMSTDFGETWTSIAGNLPSESINVIREDPTNGNILYVGTDLGVYASLDKGKTWHSLCNNLPTTPVHDLVIHPRDSEIIIGTHGRSIFVIDVKEIQNFDNK